MGNTRLSDRTGRRGLRGWRLGWREAASLPYPPFCAPLDHLWGRAGAEKMAGWERVDRGVSSDTEILVSKGLAWQLSMNTGAHVMDKH